MSKLKDIQLIVTDLDGTLLHEDKSLDDHIVKVIQEKKIPITFATGRNYHILQEYLSALDIELPYIINNGANIFIKDQCIYNCVIESQELRKCLSLLIENEVAFLAYSNTKIYSIGYQDGLNRFMERLIGKCEIIKNPEIDVICEEEIFKVVMIHPQMNRIKDQINAICQKTRCVQSEGNIFTLGNIKANKEVALRKVLEMLQIDSKNVLVFGDNHNDVCMFQVADGVAVDNATDALKKAAKYITKSNEENGVSDFLLKMVE